MTPASMCADLHVYVYSPVPFHHSKSSSWSSVVVVSLRLSERQCYRMVLTWQRLFGILILLFEFLMTTSGRSPGRPMDS